MTQAVACISTPPLTASKYARRRTRAAFRAIATPTSQERADELLLRWRLARVAGLRLDPEDRQ
jgi:hypothetical protein